MAKPILGGTVKAVKTAIGNSSGRAVCIEHNINNTVFCSVYLHLAKVLVESGNVDTETIIGIEGSSGTTESQYGRHLHLAVYTGVGYWTDPSGYCSSGVPHPLTFEKAAGDHFNPHYYGPDESMYPRCWGSFDQVGVRWFDPYAVITTNAEIIRYFNPL
jgi:murein DD-endopeptidase MepM/ murein hydrolase activator NlpD